MSKILKILLLQLSFLGFSVGLAQAAYQCGESFSIPYLNQPDMTSICQCAASNNGYEAMPNYSFSNDSTLLYCCGFVHDTDRCSANADPNVYSCGEYSKEENIPEGATCNCPGAEWQTFYEWNGWIFDDKGTCCGWTNDDKSQCLDANPTEASAVCGEAYTADSGKTCICGGDSGKDVPITEGEDEGKLCCGWYRDGECKSSDSDINDIEVTSDTLDNLNPFKIGNGSVDLSTPGKIISRALKFFVFPIAGVILFIILILGGFQMLAGASNSKSLEEGKQRITAAIIGFILLFAAYWIAQLLEIIFGIRILS